MAPWNGPIPSRPWDVLQADAVLQFYPWRDMVFEAWRHGQLPAWNPYELAGTPLLANSQSAALYPLHILVGVLHVPTAPAITFLAWFHLLWAGFGVFFLARKLGSGRVGALTAGVCFQLSPFMLAWTALPSVITTVSWIPWVLGIICTCFEDSAPPSKLAPPPDWKTLALQDKADLVRQSVTRTLDKRTRHQRKTVALALAVAMMLLGGHLQFAAYGLMAAALLAVWLLVAQSALWKSVGMGATVMRREVAANSKDETLEQAIARLESNPPAAEAANPTRLGRHLYAFVILPAFMKVVIAVCLGIAIAAPQLLPVLNYGKFSHRSNTPTRGGYEAYVRGAVPFAALQGIGFPTALGNPAKPVPLDIGDPQARLLSSYWPQLRYLGANFAETAIGFGPLVLLLLAFMRKPKQAAAGIATVGLVGLFLAVGTALNLPLYYLVPGWSASGSPGRAGFLFALAACVLGGAAVDALGVRNNRTRTYSAAGIGIVGLVLALTPLLFHPSYPSVIQPQLAQEITEVATVAESPIFVITLLVAVLGIGLAVWNGRYKLAVPLAGMVCAFLAYGWNLVPTSAAILPRIDLDKNQRYAFVNDNWNLLLPTRAMMPPNTAVYSRIHDIAGYDSLLHRDSVSLLRDIDHRDPAPPANGNIMFVKYGADPSKLAEAGVSAVFSSNRLRGYPLDTGAGGKGVQHIFGADVFQYVLPNSDRAATPFGPAKILDETYGTITVDARGPGSLTLKDRNMPGWSAEVDGKPTPIGGDLWREVELSAGAHRVVFRYTPPGFVTGVWASIVAIILCILWAKPWYRPQPLSV